MLHRRSHSLLAACGYLLILLFLFSDSVRTGRGISAADLIYQFDCFSYLAPPGYRPANALLEDQVTQFEPWRYYARQQIRSGHLPIDNPWQGGGVPLLGNYQSALLYPTQLAYYVLPENLASLLSAVGRLLAAGLGTWLLCRSLGISRPVAWTAGAMFALGGFNVAWLGHPHSNCSILLPWVLWMTLRLFCCPRRHRWRRVIGLGIVAALLMLGGHPATVFHVLFCAGTLALFLALRRLWRARRRAMPRRAVLPSVGRALGRWGVAMLLGALLASPALVPFVLYLRQSAAWVTRQDHGGSAESPRILLTWLAPNVFGNPRDNNSAVSIFSIPAPQPIERWLVKDENFNEAIGGYVGSAFLLASPFGLLAQAEVGGALGLVAWRVFLRGRLRSAGHFPACGPSSPLPLQRQSPVGPAAGLRRAVAGISGN